MPLETEARAQVRALIADLKPNDGDLLQALHRIQHEYGYISREAMEVVAEQLGLYAAEVYGATTFYSEFRLEPPPAVTVRWCGGPACLVRNGRGIRDAILATLGLQELGEQTADGRVGTWLGQCNGTCELAPMMWLEEHGHWDEARVVGHLTAARAVRMARALRDGASVDEVTRG
ncbi:MAG: hypothetical protein FJZ92_12480 [Chloroflexi bacterium]|nr:hypothetical protein [Chloroflexota bacterium]